VPKECRHDRFSRVADPAVLYWTHAAETTTNRRPAGSRSYFAAHAAEFLTDDGAAAYGRYAGVPSRADLERAFFLDEDRALIERRRGEHMKLGLSLQLITVRRDR
jgi:hypothetical protein